MQRRHIMAIKRVTILFFCVVFLILGVWFHLKSPPQVQSSLPRDSSQQLPESVEKALETIQQNVDYAMRPYGSLNNADKEQLKSFFTAISIMNYVQSHISSTQYGFILYYFPIQLPKTLEECFSKGAGICGHHSWAFLVLARKLGLPARSVEFYWTSSNGQPNSHAAVEVKYGGEWRYFDVTWSTFFIPPGRAGILNESDVLSFKEVQALSDIETYRITNQSILAYRIHIIAGINVFEYIRKSRSILFGKEGRIYFEPDKIGDKLVFTPMHKPNYIGAVLDYSDGGVGRTTALLTGVGNKKKLTIHVLTVHKNCTIRVSRGRKVKKMRTSFPTPGPIEFSLGSPDSPNDEVQIEVIPENPDRVGCITFKQIAAE